MVSATLVSDESRSKNSNFIESFDSRWMQLSFSTVGECEGTLGFVGFEYVDR